MAIPINTQNPSKELPYDLRQIYANLLGDHLIAAAINRQEHKFYNWLKALEDIKTISQHKFHDKDKALSTYNEKKNKIIGLSNKYRSTFLGITTVSREFNEIELALRDLEEFLYDEMESGNVFGKGMGDRHY